MQSTVTNENLAEYSNTALTTGDWENAARLVVGGTLIAYGLVKRSPLGFVLAALGGGIASAGLLSEKTDGNRSLLSSRTGATTEKKVMVRRAITIGRPIEEVYDFWSKPENLQRIMPHVVSIQPLPDERWEWKLGPIGGKELTVQTEKIVSDPPSTMSWKSVQDSPLEHAGSVTFKPAPGDKGTEVVLTVSWLSDKLGASVVLPFLGKGSAWHASESLRRSKQLLETGELSTAEYGKPQFAGAR